MALVDRNFVFVIGAPRSGTTWVQTLLGAHPEIVTGQESHLFWRYLLPLWEAWQHGLQSMTQEKRHIGLASYLTQEEFDELLLHFIDTVFAKLDGIKPAAQYILEKTPDHTLHLDLIDYYLPAARYIHIIRDGRDVAASMIASSQSWGQHWAPGNVRQAATTWTKYVAAGRQGRAWGDRYTEVRYERLLTHGVEELARLFDFLGIEVSAKQVARIYESQRFENRKDGWEAKALVRSGEVLRQAGSRLKEPEGFYRKGAAGGWKSSFSPLERQIFYQEAGDLLVELGYEDAETVQRGRPLARAAYACYHTAQPLLRRLRLDAPLKAARAVVENRPG